MPHYKDGTVAKVGDIVRGTTYNQKEVVTGVLADITQGVATCNAKVVYAFYNAPAKTVHSVNSSYFAYQVEASRMDYTQVDYLELVYRQQSDLLSLREEIMELEKRGIIDVLGDNLK